MNIDQKRKAARAALEFTLGEHYSAVKAMVAETNPNTPLPRPRIFKITSRVTWPKADYLDGDSVPYSIDWDLFGDRGNRNPPLKINHSEIVMDFIMRDCKGQPALVLKAVESLQRAAAWCAARATGRKRAAVNIMNAQDKSMKKLETVNTLAALNQNEDIPF